MKSKGKVTHCRSYLRMLTNKIEKLLKKFKLIIYCAIVIENTVIIIVTD